MDVVPALQFILARVGKRVNSHIVFVPCGGGAKEEKGQHKNRGHRWSSEDSGAKEENHEDMTNELMG